MMRNIVVHLTRMGIQFELSEPIVAGNSFPASRLCSRKTFGKKERLIQEQNLALICTGIASFTKAIFKWEVILGTVV